MKAHQMQGLSKILLLSTILFACTYQEASTKGGESDNREIYFLKFKLASGSKRYTAFLDIEAIKKSKNASGDPITGYELNLEVMNTSPGKERYTVNIKFTPEQKTQLINEANGSVLSPSYSNTSAVYNYGYGINSDESKTISAGFRFTKNTDSGVIFKFYD